jgi:hypothetical protein
MPAGAKRADLGKPIDGFFARQPAHLRTILDTLRKLIKEAAPEAQSLIPTAGLKERARPAGI